MWRSILGGLVAASAAIAPGPSEAQSAGQAGSQCHSRPSGQAPSGQHWYYFTDRERNRRCWFLAPKGAGAAKRRQIEAQAETRRARAAAVESDDDTDEADEAETSEAENSGTEAGATRPSRTRTVAPPDSSVMASAGDGDDASGARRDGENRRAVPPASSSRVSAAPSSSLRASQPAASPEAAWQNVEVPNTGAADVWPQMDPQTDPQADRPLRDEAQPARSRTRAGAVALDSVPAAAAPSGRMGRDVFADAAVAGPSAGSSTRPSAAVTEARASDEDTARPGTAWLLVLLFGAMAVSVLCIRSIIRNLGDAAFRKRARTLFPSYGAPEAVEPDASPAGPRWHRLPGASDRLRWR